MLRVLRIAKDLGIDAYGSPTTDSPERRDPGAAARRHASTSWARWPGTASSAVRRRSAGSDRPAAGGGRSRPDRRGDQRTRDRRVVGDWAVPAPPASRSSRRRAGSPGLKTPSWPVERSAPILGPMLRTHAASAPGDPSRRAAASPHAEAGRSEGVVKQVEDATFVDLIACERDCRTCSYAAALDCDGNCGVCPHNALLSLREPRRRPEQDGPPADRAPADPAPGRARPDLGGSGRPARPRRADPRDLGASLTSPLGKHASPISRR